MPSAQCKARRHDAHLQGEEMRYSAYFLICLVYLFSSDALGLDSPPRSQPAAISFNLVRQLPTIDAEVNGVRVLLYVDLGAFKGIALSGDAMSKAGITLTGDAESFRNASGDIFTTKIFKVAKLKLGDLLIEDLEGVELGDFKGLRGSGLDGYIGFGLLREYALVFDYSGKTLSLYPTKSHTLRRTCGNGNFPIRVSNGVTETVVKTDRGDLIFQIDTGASDNVLRPSAVSMNANTNQTSYPFSKFDIGALRIGRIRMPLREFGAPDVDGVLGTTFFEGRTVCLDFSEGLGWIKNNRR